MNDLCFCSPDLELQCLKLMLKDTRDTFILNVYKPPSGDVQVALDHIEYLVGELTGDRNPDVIIAGDFNIDLMKDSPSCRLAKSFANNLLQTQLVKSATRVTTVAKPCLITSM